MNNNSKLNKLENKLRFSNYSDKKEMLNYIKMGIYDFDEDILYDILMIIIEKDFPFIDAMNNAKMLYECIVFDKENIEERNLLLKFLSVYNKSGYDKIVNFKDLYVLFEDKKLFLVLYEKMKELDGHKQTYIYHYINRARTYFVDETMFFSSIMELIEKDIKFPNFSSSQRITNDAVDKAKQEAGVYPEISFKEIENLRKKAIDISSNQAGMLSELDDISASIDSLKEKVEKTKEKLDYDYKNIDFLYDEVNRRKKSESSKVSMKLDIISEKLDNSSKETKETSNVPKHDETIENNELLDLIIEGLLSQTKRALEETTTFNAEETLVDEKFKRNLKSVILEVKDLDKVYFGNFKEYLKFYYYSLYNNNLELFHEVMKNIKDFNSLDIRFFDKNNSLYFTEKEKITLVCYRSEILKLFIENDDLNALKELLKFNPYFNIFSGIKYEKLKQAINIFGYEKIANSDSILQKNIANCPEEELDLLRSISFYNEEFKLKHKETLTKGKMLLEICEIANLTECEQDRLNQLRRLDTETIKKHKEILRKIILYKDSIYLYEVTTIINLVTDKEFNISIDEYLNLDYEEEINVFNSYEKYKKASNPFKKSSTKKTLKNIMKNE